MEEIVLEIDPKLLCNLHLINQHSVIHLVYEMVKAGNCLTEETKRWRGRLQPLVRRHLAVANEMIDRGIPHNTTILPMKDEPGYPRLLYTIPEQIELLTREHCSCAVDRIKWPKHG